MVQMSFHSLATAGSPRRDRLRICRLCLICPKIGSIVAARFLVGAAAAWSSEFRAHRGRQRVGVARAAASQELVDPGAGDPELLGGVAGVGLPGRDAIKDSGPSGLRLGDLVQLPCSARSDERSTPRSWTFSTLQYPASATTRRTRRVSPAARRFAFAAVISGA